jgi:hypothetical protein
MGCKYTCDECGKEGVGVVVMQGFFVLGFDKPNGWLIYKHHKNSQIMTACSQSCMKLCMGKLVLTIKEQ